MSTSQYTTLVHAQPRGHPVGVTGGGAQVHQVRQVSPGGAPQLIFKVNYTTIDNLENHICYYILNFLFILIQNLILIQ